MRSKALSVVVVAALALFASTLSAQVTQVPNTGCAGAPYPTHDAAARLGQTFTFSYTCATSTRRAYAVLGVPPVGSGISFFAPITCAAGPCVFYPAPLGGELGWFPPQGQAGSWTLNVPNAPALVGATLAAQVFCYCT
ncbi:MAG: hypothetical protein IPM29_26405 [Planctomycetes bacterium]|nr:hypothetical protein [Planctomycetota bacterium]